MLIEIDLVTFAVRHEGLCRARALGPMSLYTSPDLAGVSGVDALAESEYGQAIEVDSAERTVRFGRDYLGHFPLLYACTTDTLLIGDDLGGITARLEARARRPAPSEEALALYFTLGYVPAGMTLDRDIIACEPHSLYRWRAGRIDRTSTFRAVEIDPEAGPVDVERAIAREVDRWCAHTDQLDVWCSGGVASSILALACNAGGRRAELATVGYGSHLDSQFGDADRACTQDVARQCGAAVRETVLTGDSFERAHERLVAGHPAPVMDVGAPSKYALAEHTRRMVLTGEGAEAIFGGQRNNLVVYACSRDPLAGAGRHYAQAHERWFPVLGKLMRRGEELSRFVAEHLDALFERYPGDLVRRLFYVETHVKAASQTFLESYYAARSRPIAARHPLAGLGVYRAAFALKDGLRYRYPGTKLALRELYGARLPASVRNRRDSATVLPLRYYLVNIARRKRDLSPLLDSGLFDEAFVRRGMAWDRERKGRSPYALLTLSEWLRQHPGAAAGNEFMEQDQAARGRPGPSATAASTAPWQTDRDRERRATC